MAEKKVTDSRTNLVTREEMRRYIGDPFERTDWTCFRVYLNVSMTSLANATEHRVKLDSKDFDLRSEFNTTLWEFVADQDGIYEFGGTISIGNLTSLDNVTGSVWLNGSFEASLDQSESTGTSGGAVGNACLVELDAGDKIHLNYRIANSAGGSSISSGRVNTFFWGKKIRNRINP